MNVTNKYLCYVDFILQEVVFNLVKVFNFLSFDLFILQIILFFL